MVRFLSLCLRAPRICAFVCGGMGDVCRIYESAPWSIEAWSRPVENSLLASTRLAGTTNNSTAPPNTVSKFVCVSFS